MTAQTILPANSAVSGGYEVANSVRMNKGSSDSLSKALSAGSQRKATYSFWIKFCDLAASESSIYALTQWTDSNNNFLFRFSDSGNLDIEILTAGGYAGRKVSNRKFRDFSAWYNFVIIVDTTDGTAADRLKIFVNGVRETSFSASTDPSSNADLKMNVNNQTLYIGQTNGGAYMDAYFAEVVWLDGTAAAATDFGEFDDSGIWKPIDVSGLTAGTNGFYLDFKASGNLGNDVFGGTDLTENNLTAIDQSTDTCTNNFATLNPLNNYWSQATFSEGNSVYTSNNTTDYYGVAQSTIGVSSGKWYFEAKNSTNTDQGILGITSRNKTSRPSWLGSTTQAYGYYSTGGTIRSNSQDTSYGASYTANDIIGIYLDLDNNKMYVSDNGALQNSGTGHSITAAASTDSGFYHLAVGDNSDNTQVWQCNFGGTSGFTVSSGNTDVNGYGNFEYDPSAGTFDGVSKDFLALCTANLSEVLG